MSKNAFSSFITRVQVCVVYVVGICMYMGYVWILLVFFSYYYYDSFFFFNIFFF